jgi:hypothetical protein
MNHMCGRTFFLPGEIKKKRILTLRMEKQFDNPAYGDLAQWSLQRLET